MKNFKKRLKPIAPLALDSFVAPKIPGNRGYAVRALWYVVNAVAFQSSFFGLLPSECKAGLLRLFGAEVGSGLVMKPGVSIKYPWFLELGNNVWIGERVWIDNHTTVRVGNNVCISQGAYIFTGNHDWKSRSFPFFCKPVEIGDGVWITAFQKVIPGTVIPAGHALIDGES